MHKLLRGSKEDNKMIKAKSQEDHTEVQISGDSRVILKELMIIVSQVLKAFHTHGQADIIMEGLVDVADQFAASITDTNINSKGEETND